MLLNLPQTGLMVGVTLAIMLTSSPESGPDCDGVTLMLVELRAS